MDDALLCAFADALREEEGDREADAAEELLANVQVLRLWQNQPSCTPANLCLNKISRLSFLLKMRHIRVGDFLLVGEDGRVYPTWAGAVGNGLVGTARSEAKSDGTVMVQLLANWAAPGVQEPEYPVQTGRLR